MAARYLAQALLLCTSLQAGWLDRKAEGWAWHETQVKEEQEPIPESLTSSQSLSRSRQELEELLADAILDPSEENVLRYMAAHQYWLGRSAAFAQTWSRALLLHPTMDPTATNFATSQYGRQLQRTWEQEEQAQAIQAMGAEYGLFFFYEGASKTSRAFAKVVKVFAKTYQWSVLGVSTDGIFLEEIALNRANNQIAEKMGINVLPALVAIDPKTQKMIPLAFGLQSLDRIEANTAAQWNHLQREKSECVDTKSNKPTNSPKREDRDA